MAIIKKNMASVPDEIPPLDAGEYIFKILKADVEDIPDDDQWNPGKQRLVLQLQVDVEGSPMHGRMLFDRITLDTDQGDVAFKRLIKSAGLIPSSDFDTDTLVDRHCKATVKNSPGKGDKSGTIYANVKQYQF